MAEYRKQKGSDVWHWCRNCSEWPTGAPGIDYVVRHVRPQPQEMHEECRLKEASGSCMR